MMHLLAGLVTAISRLNGFIGRIFSWLALATVIACFWVVVQRYLFSTTQLWLQDLYVWLGGAMFMAVAGYALMRDDHVRVDIFYRPASLRSKAIRDLIGVVLFLIPYCVVAWIYAFPYVQRSWLLMEPSSNPGGMPGLYILKAFILVFIVLVGLQGLAMGMRSILVLAGRQELLPTQYRYQHQG
jgi:TRAP-type mannitol/chloroaromatic compound transport system permease small subunit